MRRLSLLPVLLLLAVPAIAAEIALAPIVEGTAPASQSVDSGASDGNDYLIVWADARYGTERRATRVTRDGVVLDRAGIRIPSLHDRNSVIWTGTSYLIVWNNSYPSEIRAARIAPNGTIVDGPRTLKANAYALSVIRAGAQVVIGYHTHEEPYGSFDKRAMFLDANAAIAADVLLDERSDQASLNIAWNGTHFAALWVNPGDGGYTLEALRFDSMGRIDAAPRVLLQEAVTDFVETPLLASDGDGYLMLSRRANDRFAARRLDASLAFTGSEQLLPELTYEPTYRPNYSTPVLWNGSHYVMFGHDGHSITAVRLDRGGRTVATNVVEEIAGSLSTPVAATNGRDLFVGWTGHFATDSDFGSEAFGTLVSAATFDRRERALLSVGTQIQRRPLVASGGTNLLAVWQEGVAIHARRLTPDGAMIDAEPLRLAERGLPSAVVFNGSSYVVIWPQMSGSRATGVMTTTVPRDGALRAGTTYTLADAEPVAAASDGVTTLLLWRKESALYASRILADGSIEGRVTLSEYAGNAAIAAAGGTFLTVWEAPTAMGIIMCPPVMGSQIRGARVSAELVRLDEEFEVSAELVEVQPAAAWNGREWLVVWQSFGNANTELRGRRISSGGIPLGDKLGTPIILGGAYPSVTWDGSRWFLAWLNSEAIRTGFLHDLGHPLVGTSNIDDAFFDWIPVPLAVLRPNVIATSYSRITSEPSGEALRAFVNLLTVPPPSGRRRAVR